MTDNTPLLPTDDNPWVFTCTEHVMAERIMTGLREKYQKTKFYIFEKDGELHVKIEPLAYGGVKSTIREDIMEQVRELAQQIFVPPLEENVDSDEPGIVQSDSSEHTIPEEEGCPPGGPKATPLQEVEGNVQSP